VEGRRTWIPPRRNRPWYTETGQGMGRHADDRIREGIVYASLTAGRSWRTRRIWKLENPVRGGSGADQCVSCNHSQPEKVAQGQLRRRPGVCRVDH